MPQRKEIQQPLDARAFRDAMGRFTTGVTVVTTYTDERVHGMTANGFMSVSLKPPLIVVSIARRARMHDAIMAAGCYGVSVLCDHQERVSQHFAGRRVDGFSPPFTWSEGVPVLSGALAQVVATVTDAHPAGDHTLYIGEVSHFAFHDEALPLVFHAGQYRALLEQRAEYVGAWSGFALDPHGP